ncbi:hypothetical protein AB4Y44_09205 [Paraburkholderia sp. BR10937]|uniref:hypothetical protein n=1 Tax=Paraburkholderia sp. BR10937 TaxID=3236994 RepID=UPI0034D38660
MLLDYGCDPEYSFDDVANLVRMVRVEFGIECREPRYARLKPGAFGLKTELIARSFDEFRSKAGCFAVWLRTHFPSTVEGVPDVWGIYSSSNRNSLKAHLTTGGNTRTNKPVSQTRRRQTSSLTTYSGNHIARSAMSKRHCFNRRLGCGMSTMRRY